jgi:CheY-like chemotaxis protein
MQDTLHSGAGRVWRILVVDDNDATHGDFHKIMERHATALDSLEASLFGDGPAPEAPDGFVIDSAFQGQEGLELVQRALADGNPYDLAFVDLRMPPGWDGLDTIARIWEADPPLHVVLCAAYLGHTRAEIRTILGRAEGLDILDKPFEPADVLRLASSMSESCRLSRASSPGRNPASQAGPILLRQGVNP